LLYRTFYSKHPPKSRPIPPRGARHPLAEEESYPPRLGYHLILAGKQRHGRARCDMRIAQAIAIGHPRKPPEIFHHLQKEAP
jgi:hypothetical protein